MKKSRLNPVSKKRKLQLTEYYALRDKLIDMANGVSELSGKRSLFLESHHLDGREGGLLLDPFNICVCSHEEHMIENGQIPGDKKGKDYLLWLVKSIRIKQGFKED